MGDESTPAEHEGRWTSTSDPETVLSVEDGQVFNVGDSNPIGTISLEKQGPPDGSTIILTFTPDGAPEEAITGTFSEDKRTIIWADGDQWTKMSEPRDSSNNNKEGAVRVGSTSGKTVGTSRRTFDEGRGPSQGSREKI